MGDKVPNMNVDSPNEDESMSKEMSKLARMLIQKSTESSPLTSQYFEIQIAIMVVKGKEVVAKEVTKVVTVVTKTMKPSLCPSN